MRIILPEGTSHQELATPYPVQRKGDTTHHTYLDTTGRPVVVITNKGVLTESHIQNFQLQFKYVLSVQAMIISQMAASAIFPAKIFCELFCALPPK